MAILKRDAAVTALLKTKTNQDSLRAVLANSVFRVLEPNEFSNFGAEYTQSSRRPFNAGRQRRRGEIVDMNAGLSFNVDLTQSNSLEEIQDALLSNAVERFDSRSGSTPFQVNSVNATTRVIETTAASAGSLITGSLILMSGFNADANSGLKPVDSFATGNITLATGTALETGSAANTARVQHVGHQFAAGSVAMTVVNGKPRLSRGTGTFDFTTLGLIPGEWIFNGGDAVGNRLNDKVGYARISAITATYIEFDKWTIDGPVAVTNATAQHQIFFGKLIRNTPTSLGYSGIDMRFSHFERRLGVGNGGQETEFMFGALCSEMAINIPTSEKINLDLTYMACSAEELDGTNSPTDQTPYSSRSGMTLRAASDELPFNSSRDLVRHQLAHIDPTTGNPTPYFGDILESAININNNVSANKATAKFGAFAMSLGLLDITVSPNCYFTDIRSKKAIRNNVDLTYDIIAAKRNYGWILDIPLAGAGGGQLDIPMDEAIMLPIEVQGTENKFGHTMAMMFFNYLPNAAMPV